MRLILLLGLMLASGNLSAQNTLQVDIESSNWLNKLKENSTISLGSQYGSSSNIGKTPKAEGGTFLKISPLLGKDFMPSDSIVISPMLSGDFKRYNEKRASSIGDEDFAEFRTIGLFFTESGSEFSLEGGHARSKLRIPIVDNQFNTTPLLQKYYENDVRLGWLRPGEKVEITTALSLKEQKNDLLLLDRGNSYKNDYSLVSVEAGVSTMFSKTMKIGILSKLEKKDYAFRPADFSDGAASDPSSPHPFLREDAQEHGLQIITQMKEHALTAGVGLRLVKDRIFGARDSRSLKPKLGLKSSWTDKLKTNLSFSADRVEYQNFLLNPDQGKRSDLRKEWQLRSSFGSTWALEKGLDLVIQWDYSRLVTNFANGTYFDHMIAAGFQWKL